MAMMAPRATYNIKEETQKLYKMWHFHINLDFQKHLETKGYKHERILIYQCDNPWYHLGFPCY